MMGLILSEVIFTLGVGAAGLFTVIQACIVKEDFGL